MSDVSNSSGEGGPGRRGADGEQSRTGDQSGAADQGGAADQSGDAGSADRGSGGSSSGGADAAREGAGAAGSAGGGTGARGGSGAGTVGSGAESGSAGEGAAENRGDAGEQTSGDQAPGEQATGDHAAGEETTGEQAAGEQTTGQGRVRFQDPESTTPREPTLAERRARERAEQRQREAELAEQEAAERASAKRRNLLIGGGVTVGVVALVAAFYTASSYSEQANAATRYCSTQRDGSTVAEQEQFCDENYVRSHGGYVDHSSGMFFMPMVLPGGQRTMHPYRYGYTSGGAAAPAVGSVVGSPNFSKPSGTTVKGRDGGTVSRGGFGFGKTSGGS